MRDNQLKSDRTSSRPLDQHLEASDSPAVKFRSSPQIRLHPSPHIPAQSHTDPLSPQKLPQWERRSPKSDSVPRPAEGGKQANTRTDIAASSTDWEANVRHPPAEDYPQPSYQDYQDVGPAFAIPYVFETVPLSPAQDIAPEFTVLSSPAELADPDSLAAMWCLLEEESRESHSLRENDDEPGPSTRGEEPAIWLEDGDHAVERWPHTGISAPEYVSFPLADLGA